MYLNIDIFVCIIMIIDIMVYSQILDEYVHIPSDITKPQLLSSMNIYDIDSRYILTILNLIYNINSNF